MRVLVTGGAGFVGCVLVRRLLDRGHDVTVYDNLMRGGKGLLQYVGEERFHFVYANILDRRALRNAVAQSDLVVHLAAIVGYPACKRSPKLAEEVNVNGTETLLTVRRDQPILYASTGSNYGAITNEICTEKTPLNPLTLYGETKTEAEKMIIADGNSTAYRFATAFGVSPRMRLDLLVNDFVYKAMREKSLVVYERSFKRTFIHVRDMANSFVFAIDNFDKMNGEVFNMGSDKMNYSKEDIVNFVQKYVPCYVHYADTGKDEDQRNYEVSYDKISQLGLTTTIDLNTGIEELIQAYKLLDISSEFTNV